MSFTVRFIQNAIQCAFSLEKTFWYFFLSKNMLNKSSFQQFRTWKFVAMRLKCHLLWLVDSMQLQSQKQLSVMLFTLELAWTMQDSISLSIAILCKYLPFSYLQSAFWLWTISTVHLSALSLFREFILFDNFLFCIWFSLVYPIGVV